MRHILRQMAAAFVQQIIQVEFHRAHRAAVTVHHPFNILIDQRGIAHEINLHRIARTIEARPKLERRLIDDPLIFGITNDLTRPEQLDIADQRPVIGDKRDIVVCGFQLNKRFNWLTQRHHQRGYGLIKKFKHWEARVGDERIVSPNLRRIL